MRTIIITKSHVAEIRKKGGLTVWAFLSSSWLQKIKSTKEGPFGDNKQFRKKISQCQKTVDANLLSCPGTPEVNNYVVKGGTL